MRSLQTTRRTPALALLTTLPLVVLSLAACGDDGLTGGGGAGGSSAGGGPPVDGVCILHNCSEDAHCAGCSDGRNTCFIEPGASSGRCVSCDADTGTGCPEGQQCSSWGNCVPVGQECPTDATGTPQIGCSNSGDCAACDPAHQVCDTTTQTCVACTENDTAECQSTDICVDNQCKPACAADCTVDNDCGSCNGAKACNNHKCSECSATYACPAGEHCNLQTGTCEENCGDPTAPGVCDGDDDCGGCIGNQTECHQPINGGPGTCGPAAGGCEDLGSAGALTLPDPYNQITNTCSSDANCDGVGITYNVGKALRDLLGTDNIFGQEIGDANVEYGMNVCASITLADLSCGVCVPCRVDDDCQDINLDDFAGELFPGVGGAVIAFLFDQIFGPNEHALHMYCESVAAGYGVCVPCPGLINDCAPGSSGGGGGSCDHPPEEAGTALDPSCDTCAEEVCAFDNYCCDTEWDDVCVDEAASACGAGTCHDECSEGAAMGAECGECAASICELDPYCCDTAWDATCVAEVSDNCNPPCE
ncbi:MAG: hypothetical protein HOW73_34225 [Polyangiaceae bacterium]|nr:hypothetical protein [Polyangiaceae bacterium]